MIISGALIVISFVIGMFAGNTMTVNDLNRSIDKKVSSSAPTSAQVSPTIPAPAEAKQTEYGQVSEMGQFDFKVLNVENSKEAKTPTKSISTTYQYLRNR